MWAPVGFTEPSKTPKPNIWGDCLVCRKPGTGRHYGVVACEGCKSFFKRTIRAKLSYDCLAQSSCPIDKENRNRCQKCRLDKCLLVGMRPEAVQCARRPVAAPAKKKLKKAGQSHSCGPRANTEPHPTGSRIFVPQDLGPQMAADIPDPPPAAAPTPPIVEPPVCRGGGLGGGQASSVEGRDSRSSDESLPPLPAPSQISPEPRRVQREVPMVVSCGILSLQHMNFKLEPPAFYVPIVSVNYIYELASNLLFMSLNWVCTLPAFENLEERDRRALLRHSWSDLVLLGAAQCSRAFPNSAFLSLIGSHAHQNRLRGTGNRNKISRGQVTAVRNYITNLQKVTNMDPVEYAHLRAAAVFNPDSRSLLHPEHVRIIRGTVSHSLKLHAEQKQPDQPERFETLLSNLPANRSIEADLVEELFFTPWSRRGWIATIVTNVQPSGYMRVK